MFIEIHQTLKKHIITVLQGLQMAKPLLSQLGQFTFFRVLFQRNKQIINLKTPDLDSIHIESTVNWTECGFIGFTTFSNEMQNPLIVILDFPKETRRRNVQNFYRKKF